MRVGILTFHETYNPGAYLQAYATRAVLAALGHDAHVINYTSPKHRFRPWRGLILHPIGVVRRLRGWIESFRRNAAFSAVQSHLNPTRRLGTHEELEQEAFDAIIVGADIVWNYQSHQWGDDPVYFGKHTNCRRLIAYAPSCGPLDIDAAIPSFVVEGLQKFDSIAVRDDKTSRMVKKAIGKTVPIVMDPTFGLDLSVLPIGELPAPAGKYLLVYAMPWFLSDRTAHAVRQFATARGVPVVAVCYRHSWADTNIVQADPFDWVSLIRRADWVFTNSFHGTIFSAKLHKQFATDLNRAIESKTQPVLERLALQSRVLSSSHDLAATLTSNCDWSKVDCAFANETSIGAEYLRTALATRSH
jgi:hypothetical protein